MWGKAQLLTNNLRRISSFDQKIPNNSFCKYLIIERSILTMEPTPDDSQNSNDDELSEVPDNPQGYQPDLLDAYPMEVLEAVLKILKAQASRKSSIRNS